jgi:hypothetical protein
MKIQMQLTGIFGALALASSASAQLHVGDVILYVESDQVITGGSVNGSAVSSQRVFVGTFGAQGVDNFTTNPGFNSVPNQFPASQLCGLTIEGSARKWSGSDFCTVPPETITVYRSQTTFVSTDGGPQVAPPLPTPIVPPPHLAIGQTASGTGYIHTHPTYGLNADPQGNRADGVYLVQLRAWAGSPTTPSVSSSDRFYLLLGQNASTTDLDAARIWLEGRLSAGLSGAGVLCPPACRADFDRNGSVSIDDLFIYLNAWFTSDPRCDVDNAPGVSIDDLFVFINIWFGGCP